MAVGPADRVALHGAVLGGAAADCRLEHPAGCVGGFAAKHIEGNSGVGAKAASATARTDGLTAAAQHATQTSIGCDGGASSARH